MAAQNVPDKNLKRAKIMKKQSKTDSISKILPRPDRLRAGLDDPNTDK